MTPREGGTRNPWQEGAQTQTALGLVLAWLEPGALAAAGAACRAWRAACGDPAPWRAALLRLLARCCPLPPAALELQLLRMRRHTDVSWRGECVRASARWRECGALGGEGRGEVHALALCHCAARLASAAGAALCLWEPVGADWARAQPTGTLLMSRHGWESVVRVLWAPECTRLLLAGPLALSARWELAVVALRHDGPYVMLRADCGPGSGPVGWVGHSFLALHPPRLTGRHATTALWLYAASQETQSEYKGVASHLFRIYNESSAHISHALVADIPTPCDQKEDGNDFTQHTHHHDCSSDEDTATILTDKYNLESIPVERNGESSRQNFVVVWASGAAAGEEGARGWCSALAARGVRTHSPPPLLAQGSLAERHARHQRERRERRAREERGGEPAGPEPDPSEHDVRALCATPDTRRALGGRVLGLHHRPLDRCVYVCVSATAGGCRVLVVALPALRVLRDVSAPGASAPPYYVQPDNNLYFFGTPAGDGSPRVWLWARACGVRLAPLHLPAPPVALQLPPPPPHTLHTCVSVQHTALVAAGENIYTSNEHNFAEESNQTTTEVALPKCSIITDLVASRLAAAEQARRRSYELDVARRRKHAPPDCTTYKPKGEWKRVRATDGHDYAIACDAKLPAPCSPDGTPPPPTYVKLHPDAHCHPHAKPDPCSHRPRVLLQIDRSADPKRFPEHSHQGTAPASTVKNKKCAPASHPSADASPPGLTERIMRSLTLGRGSTKRAEDNKRVAGECSRRRCTPPCPPSARAGDDGWCSHMPPPAPPPRPCRKPTVAERLCRRPRPSRCNGGGNQRRSFHTAARLYSTSVGRDTDKIVADTKRDADNLKAVLEERRALKKAGRGREEVCGGTVSGVGHGAGRLELQLRLDSAVIATPLQNVVDRKCNLDPEIEKTQKKVSTPSKTVKKDSWLSIKSLQRKLSNNRKKDVSASKSAPICPPPPQPTCPPPPKPPCTKPVTPPKQPSTKPVTPPKPPCTKPVTPPRSPCPSPCPKPKPCPSPTAPPSHSAGPQSNPCDTSPKPKKVKSTGFTPNTIFVIS